MTSPTVRSSAPAQPPPPALPFTQTLPKDLLASVVVSLVALPLCLGIALASGAPLIAGVVSGIIGGIVVGLLSGSHTSVAGPAAGLTAIVATQIDKLGSFQAFLVAVIIAGGLQVALGLARAGFIASFFPSSVIKGLLAAIGLILILKQIPHVVGHDPDPVGAMTFEQIDGRNTFTELFASVFDIHIGAALLGVTSVALLFAWDKVPALKKSVIPAPLLAVLLGVGANEIFSNLGEGWRIGANHLVQVPVAASPGAVFGLLEFPDWSILKNPAIYVAGLTIAIVASLETLLNLEAVDRIDPLQRESPPNRELLAQGAGNMLAGFLGGLPMTSVIVRSSVNINAKGQTRWSAIFHGVLLLGAFLFIPDLLNKIPLASLAAILLVTGFKLASPALFKSMWEGGFRQFLPFAFTVAPIVLLDLLTGILIGLGVSIAFILRSNFKRPLRRVLERHVSGDVLRIQLANQVSFFNRATLATVLNEVPRGAHVLLDARGTDYIDPDIVDLIETFRTETAPARGVDISFVGFKEQYPELDDSIQFVDHTSRVVQNALGPKEVLQLMREGNRRFYSGERIERDLLRQMKATAPGQAPFAVVLGCIDGRTPVEIIFDMGIGDVFSARVAGNIARDKIIGSMEYSCAVAGAKLILVLGHTSCGAVTAAVDFFEQKKKASEATDCSHLDVIIDELQLSIDADALARTPKDPAARKLFVDDVARRNVTRTIQRVRAESEILNRLVSEGRIAIVGGLYDVSTGKVDFFDSAGRDLPELQAERPPRPALRSALPAPVTPPEEESPNSGVNTAPPEAPLPPGITTPPKDQSA